MGVLMKKIGIITIHRINNYGAMLQSYALNKYLTNQGYDVKTIDFRTPRVAESYKIFYPINSLMNIVRNVQALLYSQQLKKRKKRMEQFLCENLPITNDCYYSNESLKKAKLGYDYYICGSDQIWNVGCSNYSEAYFLSFAEDGARKISYAASIGEREVSSENKGIFKELLKDFYKVSVREKYAADSLSKICNKDVYTVMDPVFLLSADQWKDILPKTKNKGKYILLYALRGDIKGMRAFVKEKGKQYNLPIVVVTMNLREMQYKNKKCYDAGPLEFLNLIKNAEYVCTNSFHGVAMAIIFEKKFWAFSHEDKKNSSARIYNLLEQLGLQERVICHKDSIDFEKEIDYRKVEERKSIAVENSKSYLKEALRDDR